MSPATLFIFMTFQSPFFKAFQFRRRVGQILGCPSCLLGVRLGGRTVQVSICDSRETNGEFVVDRICRRSQLRVEVPQKFGGLGMGENSFALQNGHQARCKWLIRLERRR